jgi:hypothetical protein
MARSFVVVLNIPVKPNHYCRNTEYRKDEWRAGPLRRRKDSWKALLRVIGGTSLLRLGSRPASPLAILNTPPPQQVNEIMAAG